MRDTINVGRKSLDLYTLHQLVAEAGGYDQVTLERSWLQIGISCSSSSLYLTSSTSRIYWSVHI